MILLYIFYFFAETLHLPTCSNSVHLNLLKRFQNSCQILPTSTLASVDHLFPCEFILPCFFIYWVIFGLYSGYFEYYVMRCWILFKSYGNFEYFCFSISMHNTGHAQEFTNKFQSHFLEVLLSEIFSELLHFLELPLSVLQPESWDFIYSTLLQSLVAAHMSGAKMWRTERDNKNEGFSSILEAQLLWSKRKIPLLQNFRCLLQYERTDIFDRVFTTFFLAIEKLVSTTWARTRVLFLELSLSTPVPSSKFWAVLHPAWGILDWKMKNSMIGQWYFEFWFSSSTLLKLFIF